MRNLRVNLDLLGSDHVDTNGNVCNKLGTYEKALAAKDNEVPIYVAVPSPSIDWTLIDGSAIPIEQRDASEVLGDDEMRLIAPSGTPVVNEAFDVTPARLLNGLITERGICAASAEGLASLFP